MPAIPNKTRISVDLPPVPHSLRAFIEDAVKSERTMKCLMESPLTTLRAAGVPVDEKNVSGRDCEKLITLISNLRELVTKKVIAKDFKFEDVFSVSDKVSYRSSDSESDSVCRTEFSPNTECSSSSKTEQGINKGWNASWLRALIDERGIIAPLLSPADLAEVVARMDVAVKSMSKSVSR